MEIVKLINDTWQLIDNEGTVLIQGTYDECWDRLVEYDIEHEDENYARFLTLSGI